MVSGPDIGNGPPSKQLEGRGPAIAPFLRTELTAFALDEVRLQLKRWISVDICGYRWNSVEFCGWTCEDLLQQAKNHGDGEGSPASLE